ncbi:MAG: phytanoyl-CoA dioxygenase family protein [Planctomycetes bacterium]|nr:phytanoyl-CoA dioxygenase family protein [Planctomycetota bacterium]
MTESLSSTTAQARFAYRLQARPDQVFACFTDRERLAQWFSPGSNYPIESVAVEARPGGGLELWIGLPQGGQGRLLGRFVSLDPGRSLALELGAILGDAPMVGGLLELGFQAVADETQLEVRLRSADDHPLFGLFLEALNAMFGRLPGALDDFLDRFCERVSRFPRYRSRFGGFWPDLSDAEGRIAGKVQLGLLSEAEGELFRRWRKQGYLVFRNGVSEEAISRFETELDELWAAPPEDLVVECARDGRFVFETMKPGHRALRHKLLDVHTRSARARDLIFSPALLGFLEKLFERPAMAFQTLLFERGTGQGMHQDTAFVGLSSPMEFVGVWIALEDVVPGSGELRYYEGSHEIEEYLWLGRSKVKPFGYMDEEEFFRWVVDRSEERGLAMRPFLARRGDVLVWHADLVHGGAPDPDPKLTRRSLVSHLCPVDVDPEYVARDPSHRRHQHGSRAYWCAMKRD